ncbi:hydroxymethylbilane synthase [Desulfobacula sp.]|uniref:hydroxymethylbilane synthase n=1 Tax=Desulfobacula sp. TaxID=2593537 RepID=UPI00261044A8|nr:hydroxymethylbilane synthase [Desulfobacula sp.]
MKKTVWIGTRGSQLALWQANFIKSEIQHLFPDLTVELKVIKTTGDRITDRPLAMIGGKGLFVKEIETALLNKEIDLAVHSMKDMPGELPKGLTIGAIPERENPFDALISRDHRRLADYETGAKIGTSSLRRASQIKHIRPDVTIVSIRGNLDTRIKKLDAGEYDAIVLAAAGLRRLGQANRITEYLDETTMIPAVGQGALCIETRQHDDTIAPIMAKLDHSDTHICVTGERAFLRRIEGSCHIPVACFGKITDQGVMLTAVVASEDGRELIREQLISPLDQMENAGQVLADKVLEKGGKKILERLNSNDG